MDIKLIKKAIEMGFKEPVVHVWYLNEPDEGFIKSDKNKQYFLMLTLIKQWLQNKHGIHIELCVDYDYSTKELWDESYTVTVLREGYYWEDSDGGIEYIYSLEKGIEKALELI